MKNLSAILTNRDIEIINILKKFSWIREDYLAKFLKLNWQDVKAKNILSSLAYRRKKDNLFFKKKILNENPSYWFLGKSIINKTENTRQRKIILGTLKHDDLVTELAIDLMLQSSNNTIITEEELKLQMSFKDIKNTKLPDIVLNDNTAIKVEISQKNDKRLQVIVNTYIASKYENIIYYTNNQTIASKISYYSKNNSKFKIKLFRDNSILDSQDYIPELVSKPSQLRANSGQFTSSIEEKLYNIGAFTK